MGRFPGRRLGIIVAIIVAIALTTPGCGGGGSDSRKPESDAIAPVQTFLDRLDAAVREGNTDFRVARLHPAVIDRYGEQQCRDFLADPQAQDPSRRDEVLDVEKPDPFVFTTDDGAVPIANAQQVLVRETFQKKKSRRELHVARVDGQFRYFIDCGTPLARQ